MLARTESCRSANRLASPRKDGVRKARSSMSLEGPCQRFTTDLLEPTCSSREAAVNFGFARRQADRLCLEIG